MELFGIGNYVFSFVLSLFIVLVFRQVDKKRSNIGYIRRMVDQSLEKFRKIMDERREDLDKTSVDLSMLLNKGQAINNHFKEQMNQIDKKLSEVEKSESLINDFKSKMGEIYTYVESVNKKMDSLKKESDLIKAARIDISELTKNYQDISKKSDELEKNILQTIESKKINLEQTFQENSKKAQTILKTTLDDLKEAGKQKIESFTVQYKEQFQAWTENKKREVSEVNKKIIDLNEEINKVNHQALTQIEKEFKEKKESMTLFFDYSKDKMDDQTKKIQFFKDDIVNDFTTKYNDFINEMNSKGNFIKTEVQKFEGTLSATMENFKRETNNHVVDISKRLSSFEETIQKVDKIAQENEIRINREIEAKIKEIEQGLKNKFDSAQNKIERIDNIVKEVLVKFQDKVNNNLQVTYNEIEKEKSNILSSYKQIEERINSFTNTSEELIGRKIKELNEKYDKGHDSVEKGIRNLQTEYHKIENALKVEMRRDIEGFKSTLEKERETITGEVKEGLKSFDKFQEKIKYDFEKQFMETQKAHLDQEVNQIRQAIDEIKRTTQYKMKEKIEELEKQYAQKNDEFIKSINSKKDETLSKMNEYQTIFESNVQKNEDKVKDF
ncbi:MAG TPA: hypothetical protein DHW82_00310, partial [Spirochaetia bacterium]|nr:hypothetical protein [Spirochaetia bacterium]